MNRPLCFQRSPSAWASACSLGSFLSCSPEGSATLRLQARSSPPPTQCCARPNTRAKHVGYLPSFPAPAPAVRATRALASRPLVNVALDSRALDSRALGSQALTSRAPVSRALGNRERKSTRV